MGEVAKRAHNGPTASLKSAVWRALGAPLAPLNPEIHGVFDYPNSLKWNRHSRFAPHMFQRTPPPLHCQFLFRKAHVATLWAKYEVRATKFVRSYPSFFTSFPIETIRVMFVPHLAQFN
jgi:hypothetical protein